MFIVIKKALVKYQGFFVIEIVGEWSKVNSEIFVVYIFDVTALMTLH